MTIKKLPILLSSLAILTFTGISSCTSIPSKNDSSRPLKKLNIPKPTYNEFEWTQNYIASLRKESEIYQKRLEYMLKENPFSSSLPKTIKTYNLILKQELITYTRKLFNNIRHLHLIKNTHGIHSPQYDRHTSLMNTYATALSTTYLFATNHALPGSFTHELCTYAKRDITTLVRYLVSIPTSHDESLKSAIHLLNTCLEKPITSYTTSFPLMSPHPPTTSSPHTCLVNIDATYPQYICDSLYSTTHLTTMRTKRYELGELVYYYTHFLRHHHYCFERFDAYFILLKHQIDFMTTPLPHRPLKEEHYKHIETAYHTEYTKTIQHYPNIILHNLLYDIDYLQTLYNTTTDSKLHTYYINYMSQQFAFYKNYENKQQQLLILYNQVLKKKNSEYIPFKLPPPHPQTQHLATICQYELNRLFITFPKTKHEVDLQHINQYLTQFITN